VTDSVENDKVAAWYNAEGKSTRAIVLAIQRQPGTNTIEVVDRNQGADPRLPHSACPAPLNSITLFDRTETIRDSVHDVEVHFWC